MQTLTNILYIKIPVFDPDCLLKRMLRCNRLDLLLWFFALSIAPDVVGGVLVATHFETFRAKLPDNTCSSVSRPSPTCGRRWGWSKSSTSSATDSVVRCSAAKSTRWGRSVVSLAGPVL